MSAYHLYRKFREEFKWNGTSRWKFSEKSDTFRGITFFRFLPKRWKLFVPFFWLTSDMLPLKAGGDFF